MTLQRFHWVQSFLRIESGLFLVELIGGNNSYQMTLEWFHSVQSFMRTACKLYMSKALFTFIFIRKHRIVKLFQRVELKT